MNNLIEEIIDSTTIRVPQNTDIVPNRTATLYVVSNKLVNASQVNPRVERQRKINQEFHDHVDAMIRKLLHGKIYTLENICGEAFWNCYEASERRVAGRYIASLVAEDVLPLVALEKNNSSNHKRYLLK
jgi:hypothetical protein